MLPGNLEQGLSQEAPDVRDQVVQEEEGRISENMQTSRDFQSRPRSTSPVRGLTPLHHLEEGIHRTRSQNASSRNTRPSGTTRSEIRRNNTTRAARRQEIELTLQEIGILFSSR